MTPSESQFPALEISISGKRKLAFSTFAAMEQFFMHERQQFRPILENNLATRTNPGAQFLQNVSNQYRSIETMLVETTNTLSRFSGQLDANHTEELKRNIQRHAQQLTSGFQTLYSGTTHSAWMSNEPAAQFILALAKTSVNEAAFAFLHLHAAEFDLSPSADARNGFFKAQLYQAGITSLRGDAESAAMRKLTDDWRAETQKMSKEIEAQRDAATILNKDHATELASHREQAGNRTTKFTEFVVTKAGEHDKVLADAKAELKKLAETYDQHMKLQAPVEYWRRKKDRHRDERSKLQFWTISVGGASFALLGAYVWLNFHDSPAGTIPWREIFGFFVLSSLAFWAVKILVRLLLSAVHLAEDAAEREVMAMTYMALVRGDGTATKYMEEKDRALVLGPLFRPSATGVIDDGAPPHVSEIITKIGK